MLGHRCHRPFPLPDRTRCALVLAVWWLMLAVPAWASAWSKPASAALDRLARGGDAIAVADGRDRLVYHRKVDTPKIPASTLKLLTALVAFRTFGADYRFPTEVYMDDSRTLTLKGYGDPLLISEVLVRLTAVLAQQTPGAIDDLRLDGTYFQDPLVIPGVSDSLNPYDAPNGALCVNFNTVTFETVNGELVSAEPQTPLIPYVMDRVRRSGMKQGRIVLTGRDPGPLLYAGHLAAHFLAGAGMPVTGRIYAGRVDPASDSLVLRHRSPYALPAVVEKMLEFSNNFMANQLLIAAGARTFGPPGNLEKGARCAAQYLSQELQIDDGKLVEGSGISRNNRLTARAMLRILSEFRPHRNLMRRNGPVLQKTGTLRGIRTRAGYVEAGPLETDVYPFVVFSNSPTHSVDRIVAAIAEAVLGD